MAEKSGLPRLARIGLRIVSLALLGALLVFSLILGPPLFFAFVPRWFRRTFTIGFLSVAQVVYAGGFLACVIGVPILSVALIRSRRRRVKRPILARLLLVSASCLIGIGMVEGGAAIARRLKSSAPDTLRPSAAGGSPAVPPPSSSKDELFLVVVGESSAQGVPYHERLSVGQIVAWQLQKALPHRRVRVEVQARAGLNLAQMEKKFGELSKKPDIVIVYAGHNEFSSRYAWFHGWPYYVDDKPSQILEILKLQARNLSTVCTWIQDAIARQRIDQPPPRWITRKLVDVPVYTPREYAQRLAEFRNGLDQIAGARRDANALTVMVIPSGNDAGFEPNRSFLAPFTTRAEREAFTREFALARNSENSEPTASLKQYEALLDRQPTFAETHYRIARLLQREGRLKEAYQHDIKARDLDGLPMRCLSDFQDAYRDVARKHKTMLVDGQQLFHDLSPTGLLDDAFFNDPMHPSLRGHIALAQEILNQLHTRPELGWPAGTPVPVIDPIECMAHFKMDIEGWKDACESAAQVWRMVTFARHDPAERLRKTLQLDEATRKLEAGQNVESLKIPGFGLSK